MAVSANTRFGNGELSNAVQVSADFDKFEENATPKFKVGHKVEDHDGAVYRYVHFGATVNRGVLVAQDLSESSAGDSDNGIVASASCVTTTDGTIGSKYIQMSYTGATANQFAGGKLITTDDTGEGYTYDIVGNTATGDPAAGDIRIELKQPIKIAVDATTDVIILGNRYANLEIATRATDNILAGVSCTTISTAGYYGWVQTKGIVGILCAGTDVAGNAVQLSDTSGAVVCVSTTEGDTTSQIVGTVLVAGDSGGHGAYYIDLE